MDVMAYDVWTQAVPGSQYLTAMLGHLRNMFLWIAVGGNLAAGAGERGLCALLITGLRHALCGE